MFQTFLECFVFGRASKLAASFSSKQVTELTGITARQLQWWDERGIVVPRRQGHSRLYSLEDMAELAVILDLRGRGFSLQKVRKVMRFLQRELGKRLVETVSSGSEYHLLTDGRHIFLEDSAQRIVDLLKNTRQPMLAVCLTDTVRQIRAELLRAEVRGQATGTTAQASSGSRRATAGRDVSRASGQRSAGRTAGRVAS
jgi:DNA-binding transcriptional MerR regulator